PFVATGVAIEKTSGKSWEDNLDEQIFTPLNMTSASSTYPAFLASPDHVTLYRYGILTDNTTGTIPIDPDWAFNNVSYEFGPAGGINANIKDMATWTIFQMGNGSYNEKQLISPANMAYMHTPRTPIMDTMTDQKLYYCQAWIYNEKAGAPSFIWHNGETLGSHAMILFVPSENLGIVVLSNVAGGTALPDCIAMSFYRQAFGLDTPDTCTAYQAMAEKSDAALLADQPVRPAHPAEPLSSEKYTGSYTNTIYGKAVVAEQAGNLTLTFGKTPVTFVLSPWDGNTFASTCPQWGPDYNGRVTFSTGSDGSVTGLTTTLILDKDFNRDATFVRA
ncbi:MAG: serine hydrolase, partial [Methanoregula sp.]